MENWEEVLEESIADSTLRRGELREGKILSKTQEGGLVVDIGAKRDGYVPPSDLESLDEVYEVGQTVKVLISRVRDSDGNVELSISQALLREDWLRAEEMMETQELYETTVVGSNRGGLTVNFGRLRGFVPMSQLIGFSRIRQPGERYRRLESKVGKPIMLKVIEVDRRRRRLILSELAAAKEWRAARRAKLLQDLEPGQVRRGRISQIADFGLFVNLGGLDGLVHVSELSWGRVEHPEEVYRVGQRIRVKVLSVDRDQQRIALSIKALTPDPWETAPDRYKEGQLVEGKITQLVDFGIFVELEPGVEGLLHNSELGSPEQREELEVGQKLLVKIIRVEPERRRIGLSVRQVTREEWESWVSKPVVEAEAEAQIEEEVSAAKPDVEEHEAEVAGTTEEIESGVQVEDEDTEQEFVGEAAEVS